MNPTTPVQTAEYSARRSLFLERRQFSQGANGQVFSTKDNQANEEDPSLPASVRKQLHYSGDRERGCRLKAAKRRIRLKTNVLLRFLFAAHTAASPSGGSPVMVNDDEPSSHNRRGKG